MRVAILEPSAEESRRLRDWFADYSRRRAIPMELVWTSGQEDFQRRFRPNFFRGVVIASGGVAGFLAARRVRESDRDCRIIVIDDSERYSIQCYRFHVTDFLIRPIDAAQIFRSIDRILY